MKTIIAMLLAAFCISATAVQVDWSVARGSFKTVDGTGNPTGYLVTVFLASDLTTVQSAFSNAKSASDVSGAISSKVFSSGTTNRGAATGFETVTGSYTSGTTLDLFAVAWDATSISGAGNYILSSTFKSDAYEAPATPTNDGNASAAFSGKSWTAMPVPEPATGALALAGIALLLKRRKAAKA